MQRYGQFRVAEAISSNNGATIYMAEGKVPGDFVVKVFLLSSLAKEPAKAEAFGNSFYRQIEVQKRTAQNSRYVAPILQHDLDEKAAWYATRHYPSSVEKLIATKTILDEENFFRLIHAIVQGALDCKKNCGRSHGNLKPSNILLNGTERSAIGQVALSDPASGDISQSKKYELADLRAIGEIIYRLGAMPEKQDNDAFTKLPPPSSLQEWTKIFGSNGETWHALYSQLLDPQLMLKTYDLEKLALDISRLNPGSKRPTKRLALAVGLVLTGLAIGLFWKNSDHGSPRIEKPPATMSKEIPEQKAPTTPVKADAEEKTAQEGTAHRPAEEIEHFTQEERVVEKQTEAEAPPRQNIRLKFEAVEKARQEAVRKAAEADEKRLAAEKALQEARRRLQIAADETERLKAEEDRRTALTAVEQARQEAAERTAEALRKTMEAERISKEAQAGRLAMSDRASNLTKELGRMEKERDAEIRRVTSAPARRPTASNLQKIVTTSLETPHSLAIAANEKL